MLQLDVELFTDYVMFLFLEVVGSIDQMEVDATANTDTNSGSGVDAKNNAKTLDSDRKGKRKLYVGSQALGYRRDNMEVCFLCFLYLVVQ